MSISATAPVGKWVIVRSDRLVLSVDKTDHVYVVGRGRQLPSAQLLSHKYASREHLAVVWHPPHLYMIQEGKNPSFLGASCTPVPRLNDAAAVESDESAPSLWQRAPVRFSATAAAKEATAHQSAGGIITVDVPLCDPLTVTQAPDRHAIDAATVHFPEELALPTLTVRFEGTEVAREDATAAATTRTTAEMLAVPSVRALGGGDDDNDELSDEERKASRPSNGRTGGGEGAAAANGSGKPGWRGLLDVALQQQQQQDMSDSSPAAQVKEARSESQRSLGAVAPSAQAPFGSASEKAPAPACADPAPHKLGIWEWKNHIEGKGSDPMPWRKYNLAVAALLEKAYQDTSLAKIKIPDSAMFGKPDAKGYTYGVCFAEKALDGAMIQYSLKEPSKFCVIRRTGGPPVDRKRAKKAHVIASPPSSEDSESNSEDSCSDDSEAEESAISSSLSINSSTSSDGTPPKKRRRPY
ncbi:conserved hypothetical protein [Leishmania infantum JPCM5]|uniref:Uncharacterized protein n=3 Tax=Leishmania donovani species complex TaxID=38574 RepID=A4I3K1_LEIIN|nr:conserved hypothetical protein [Leishmania infantum JPCM5]XP_003862232.1 hypothetical protein, conserved [Leishmania donovani]CAC9503113.1 hypothetical_protein_-_conserved [Leishmania infantum]AYU80283.1 hypothetical protein LdCL_280017900 [Leishmania donovani]CAM69355.1 conserved hypothetical protein [Leishmania infantum JPCM5]CBZ35538.1 hypothetical protein, conserved [Leishmania donovani]SUZ43293.1 hypothetical_protein_-_conserved [Leishmania infantum]|eukprot:XP_001470163.1 conserved hypothetical protein [Leishmania infantum JPCM5]